MLRMDEAVTGIEGISQMDGTEFQLSLERLRGCIRSRDNDEIENVVTDLDVFTIEVERWPDGFFEGLEGLMRDPHFLGLANSWKLFYFIANNWEQISEREKERLREVVLRHNSKRTENSAIPCRHRCPIQVIPFIIENIIPVIYI